MLDAAHMPEGALERLAPSAVAEVGHQGLVERIERAWPVGAFAPALNAAAAAPGLDLWSLQFLEATAPLATPQQLAGMTLNIDYCDTVPKMLAFMDQHPDGLEEALTTAIRDGRGYPPSGRYGDQADGDFGLATASAWVGRRALADGRELDDPWTDTLLTAAEKPGARKHLAEAFGAAPLARRETWLLSQWSGWNKPWNLVPSTPTATWDGHPLLAAIARGVWWGLHNNGTTPLRIDGDALVDIQGRATDWPDGAELAVIHPLELDEGTRAMLATFGLSPVFRQLGRPVFQVEPNQHDKKVVDWFEDAAIGTGRLRGLLERRRWVRGEPQDAGHVAWYTKAFPRAELTVKLTMDPGFGIGWGDDGADQAVSSIEFGHGLFGRKDLPWRLDQVRLGEVDPIVFSEVLADVHAMAQ